MEWIKEESQLQVLTDCEQWLPSRDIPKPLDVLAQRLTPKKQTVFQKIRRIFLE